MQHPSTHNVVEAGQVTGPVVQANQIGQVVGQMIVHQGQPGPAPTATEDAWVTRVRDSSVWEHVPGSRSGDAAREQVAAVAAALAALRDEAGQELADDPWQDPGCALRFLERIEWVLGEPGQGPALDLYPAEAAAFVLTPLLARVHDLRAAVEQLAVAPWRLGPWDESAGRPVERGAFDAFTDGHSLLVQRALLRPAAQAPIGWWLFHRWLVQREAYGGTDAVAGLLDAVGAPAEALGDALSPLRVSRLLHGLRRGPDVCNPEYLEALPADDRLRGPGHQRIRDRRLALLTALALAATAEMAALPDIVVEHLGIPHPVDLPALRRTLEESSWGGSHDLPVLRADCAHEAVVEGLRVCCARMDELLHGVHRTVRDRITVPMPALPGRLSADGVVPAGGAFTGWASFRLDERRVRGLLMGIQLYKDRDLAVRELYQNALDACRYRRARTAYLDRTHAAASYTYEGEIRFEQDVDDDGREYLECRDNGIGMGEAELRGVFSNAGARFAEQPDFKEERAAWARLDPPVPFFPNSRFGIGVLSYFMLADEIRVTTCRMGPSGEPGPVLQVSIFGPGHLFRIVRVADRGAEPGTTVRLYLREAGEDGEERAGWSSPDVLARVLGIAEFPTVAAHGERTETWEPGVLHPRDAPSGEQFGLDAHGDLLPWTGAPDGAQVIWCDHGGALLVDGLVVHPAVRGDVLSTQPAGLVGAVVNLSGPYAPERLSADRAEVLDDLRGVVRGLLTGAVGELVEDKKSLLTFDWLCGVSAFSMPAADLVAEACIETGRGLRNGSNILDSARTGCLPSDISFVPNVLRFYNHSTPATDAHYMFVPDHIRLWRMLAHGSDRMLGELINLCPELAEVGPVLPALPSDHALLTLRLHSPTPKEDEVTLLVNAAAAQARSPRAVASRAARLGLHTIPPDLFPDMVVHPVGVAETTTAVRATVAARSEPVTVAWLLRVAEAAGMPVEEAADHWGPDRVPEAVRRAAVAAQGDHVLRTVLSEEGAEWFETGAELHPGHLAAAARAAGVDVLDLCWRLTACGLTADGRGLTSPLAVLAKLLSEDLTGEGPWLSRAEPVPPLHVLLAADRLKITPGEARGWYARLGFTPPSPFPEVIMPNDSRLLEDYSEDDGFYHPPLRPGAPIPFTQLLANVAHVGLGLEGLTRRLRDFGVDVEPMGGRFTALDEELFTEHGPLPWYGVRSNEVIPFAHVMAAARTLLVPPRDIAVRLVTHGLSVSCLDLPEGLTHATALMLLEADDDALLDCADTVDLDDLLERARRMHEPLTRVRDWLLQLGIDVVDPVEAVRAAIPLIPLRDQP
ncbi:wHTH domain-containing protein [Streptomyces purpureus]|uniref:Uncharacterized protein n=1 Tax=Streptomyces purpureus TaxID=1951 RepID=A0A918GXN0_9ACTN|nr:ATP-binding protein [Streptomyces purpureus]GGT18134.1 hypothetical protein GCM10014713_08700 [Streptomyces purpureus]